MTIWDRFPQPCNGWFQTGFLWPAEAAPCPRAGPCAAGWHVLLRNGDLLQQLLEFKKEIIKKSQIGYFLSSVRERGQSNQVSVLGTGRLDTGAKWCQAVKGPGPPSPLVAVTISVAGLLVSFSFSFWLVVFFFLP